MKAVVVHQYGGPEVLKFEEYPDPVPGPGEVLVRVAAASVNPIDYKRRAGLTKDFYPLKFPRLIGVDLAGTVVKIGPGVEGFSAGDQVFAMADNTYAELCVVKAAVLAKVPKGLDLIQAALPLVTTTGNQLLSATGIKAGRTVLVVGAAGNVGRSAVFTAKSRGATVIAGVLSRQIADAKNVGADHVVATDDDVAIANLAQLEAVADAVGGTTAEKLIAKVKPGGVFASVVEVPHNAAKYPSVKPVKVFSKFDRKTLEFMAEAVRDGKLVIPISQKLPLSEAANRGHERKIGNEKRPARNQPRFEAEWQWVCRVSGVTERLVVSSPSVCGVWAHRLLRQFSEPACVQACGGNRASDYCQLRAG